MYIIKAKTGKGWIEINRFSSARAADLWLTNHIVSNAYSPYDFTIEYRG